MNFKQKDKEIRTIFKQYNKTKIQIMSYKQALQLEVKETTQSYAQTKAQYIVAEDLINYVDNILMLLDEELHRFVEQEYLGKGTRNWWEAYYSRSTYYRYKNKVLDELLFYLKK